MSDRSPASPPVKNVQRGVRSKKKTKTYKKYVYGIKDLSVLDKHYEKNSVYVSKPYQVDGNIVQVALSSEEIHPNFVGDGNTQTRSTSIEYYVTHSLNPSLDQWYAILPEGQKVVENEYLLFDDTKRASLRFPCNTSEEVSVFRDGVKLNKDEWAFILSESGSHQVYISHEFNPNAYYTIYYSPDNSIRNPWVVDFQMLGAKPLQYINKDGVGGEIFKGTDHNGMIELQYYPHIEYSKVYNDDTYNPNSSSYTPLSVTLENANILASNHTVHTFVGPYNGEIEEGKAYTKNITDYSNTDKEYTLNPYDAVSYPFFEYFQRGRRIYFSETFNRSEIVANNGTSKGNADVKIQYKYLVSNVRIKAILRRADVSSQGVTPMIPEYSLKFKVMK